MRKLMLVVVVLVGSTAPAVAQTKDGDTWKTTAEFYRAAAVWTAEAAAIADAAAKSAWAASSPDYKAAKKEWEDNADLYKLLMTEADYDQTTAFMGCAQLDMNEASGWMFAGYVHRNSGLSNLDYGDLAYALGEYEAAAGYYEAAYADFDYAGECFVEAYPLYYHALGDAVCAAAIMAQYP